MTIGRNASRPAPQVSSDHWSRRILAHDQGNSTTALIADPGGAATTGTEHRQGAELDHEVDAAHERRAVIDVLIAQIWLR
jgi:hypothetical protein